MNWQTCFFTAKDAKVRNGKATPLRTFASFAVECFSNQDDGLSHAE
jgi:hypothetical protein